MARRDFRPVRVVAHLVNGFVAMDPWSPTLDGILGYWLLYRRLGPDRFYEDQAARRDTDPLLDMPLQRVDGPNGAWWFAVSSPIYAEVAQHRSFYHRRFDTEIAVDRADVRRKVQTKSGPMKNKIGRAHV